MAPSKKAVAKVPAKKVVVKKETVVAPVVAPKKELKKAAKPTVSLTAFSVTATIPTMPYGNIMPTISVVAATIEEARATVMPVIEELFLAYAEKPRDGSKLSFQRASVTETVKEVVPVPMPTVASKGVQEAVVAPVDTGEVNTPSPAPEAVQEAQAASQAPAEAPKSEFALRAEKMIGLAMTEEAAEKIKTQIENSEKIPAHEKPALLELVEAKITDFQSNVW